MATYKMKTEIVDGLVFECPYCGSENYNLVNPETSRYTCCKCLKSFFAEVKTTLRYEVVHED